MWHDFDRNSKTAETCAWNEKKYCPCCIILIRIDIILSKFIIFKIFFQEVVCPVGQPDTYLGFFTCPQTHGPLFFLIYINDLGEGISSPAKLFTNETSLFSVVSDMAQEFIFSKKCVNASHPLFYFNRTPVNQNQKLLFKPKNIYVFI